MLRFRSRMEFSPAAVDEAAQVLRALVGPVRAETGCTATRLLKDVGDEEFTLIYVEEWRDVSDFERHLRATTFRRIVAVMELAAVAPTVEIDEISSRRGFELVEELLSQAEPGIGADTERVKAMSDAASPSMTGRSGR